MKIGGLSSAATQMKRWLVWDTRGSMTIPGIFFFTFLMGVGGLVIDLQRVYGVHGQMQAYVDEAALAGAAELDGQTGSITRSARAACGTQCGVANGPLITGPAKSAPFATDTTLTVQKITILSVLGTDPAPLSSTPALNDVVLCTYVVGTGWLELSTCNTDTTKEKTARFIEVVAAQRTISYMVLPVIDAVGQILGAAPITDSAALQLRATAGFKAQVCDLTPLMVCNPDEPTTNTDTLRPYAPQVGQQILMKESSNTGSASWAPGDFGLLSVPSDAGGTLCNGGGANAIRCMLGLVDPLTHCINNDQINVQPGQAQSTNQGLNVRFDIYEGAMNSNTNNPAFAPAVNVTKGICRLNGGDCNYNGGNACSNLNQMSLTPSSPLTKRTVRLPRDATIQADGDNGNVRFGNANWDRAGYWSVNHPTEGAWPPTGLTANATRYDVYRWEINNNSIPNKSSTNGENGNKTVLSASCSNQPGINNSVRDRRTLTMAVVNCIASNLRGSNNNQVVRSVAYVQMFLTEPVGLNAAGEPSNISNVYGEVIGVVKPNDQSGVYHIQPILYR